MDEFFLKHQAKIKESIKAIDDYDRSLKSLSTWWQSVSLIGKINSSAVASTILGDMTRTLNQFHQLQHQLIENLIKEHARKTLLQDQSRSQMAIDVLIRNLFERTADIGFLATDQDVVNFLQNEERNADDFEFLRQCLQAYIDIYSVYQDAFLLDTQGNIKFQLSQPNRSGLLTDTIYQQAKASPNEYVEFFGESDLTGDGKKHLFYAHAIDINGCFGGVIILCFRFSNELEGIINNLISVTDNNHLLFLDGKGETLYASAKQNSMIGNKFSLTTTPEIINVNDVQTIKLCARGQHYQDYAGPENWHVCSLLPLKNIEDSASNDIAGRKKELPPLTDLSGLISAELFSIRNLSKTINDDLQLIVLNGIITAARKSASEFVPVLEAIKSIGQDIDTIFENSIESLFTTIISGQLNSVRLQAGLAVDIMDRNLYERANDCRWWGLNTQMQAALSAKEIDQKTIKNILFKIHSLYTVYHTLYVFDRSGCYVAFSNDDYEDKLGQPIEANSAGQSVFNLDSIYHYSVSPFESFDCYQGAPTYIYNAAIRKTNQAESVEGGIGIVFDSTIEFKAILTDILPRENGDIQIGSKAFFTTEEGHVIASTSDAYPVGDIFMPGVDMNELKEQGSLSTIMRVDGEIYLIGAARSKGYREYKREDGYQNSIIAWVLAPC